MAVVRSPDFLRALNQRDCACNIDPPASSYAIMRRAGPYRGENSGPGKDDRGELDIVEPRPSEIWLKRSDIWLVRRLSQKTADFGVIAIDLGRVPTDAIKEMRHRKVLRELGWCRGNCGIHRNTSTASSWFAVSHHPAARPRPRRGGRAAK